MTLSIQGVSTQARIAEPGADISLEELALAARNHAMPLEAMRYDVTPPGLHYVLNHFDIPYVDADTWRLEIHGCVETPISPDEGNTPAPGWTGLLLLGSIALGVIALGAIGAFIVLWRRR
jgi:hypothetical protein